MYFDTNSQMQSLVNHQCSYQSVRTVHYASG